MVKVAFGERGAHARARRAWLERVGCERLYARCVEGFING